MSVADYADLFWQGFTTTLSLTVLSFLIAMAIGIVIASMRVSPIRPLRAAGLAYVETFRNIPLLLILLFAVFALPKLEVTIDFFPAAVAGCSLYTGAFVAEAVRSGINAVQSGQAEAARAIGMTFGQTLREVVLPQAFRTVIPPLGNILIALTKNSAIAEAFGVVEATGTFDNLIRDYPESFWALFIGTASGYVVIVLAISGVLRVVERRSVVLR